MYLAKQEDNIELAIKLYHLIVRGIKQRFGNVLHAYLGEKVALASLYSVNRFAQSVGNIIHRIALGRQSRLSLRIGTRAVDGGWLSDVYRPCAGC